MCYCPATALAHLPELDALLRPCARQAALEDLLAVDLLLDCTAGDQAVHHHILLLADAVGPVHTLTVWGRR